jgi:hypothetical protein
MTTPAPVLYFTAPLAFAPTDGNALPTRLTGIAYSGGLITHWDQPVVIDLASTALEPTAPLLYEHDRAATIGIVTALAHDGAALTLTADLFSDFDPTAADIARKATRGLDWQLSIGLFGAEAEERRTGTIELNGQTFAAPVTVLRHGWVREVSVVALGADRATQANFFAATTARRLSSEEHSMSDDTDTSARLAALEAQVSALTVERDTARAAQTAAETTLAAVQLSARTAAVQTLFRDLGRPVTDASTAHYLSLSDDAFTAVAADLRALKPQASAHLFHEQATGEPAPGAAAPNLDLTAIYAARRAN